MNHYQFNYHSLDKKAALVWEHGTFMAVRYDGGYSVVLYHLGEFLAEVWYRQEDNEIAMVHGFKSLKILDHYLKQIDIEELMK